MAEIIRDKKAHCWHPTAALMSNKFQEVCCYCGDKRQKQVYFGTPIKHGPFAPDAPYRNGGEPR